MKAGIIMAMLPCFLRKSFARFSGVGVAMFTGNVSKNPTKHRGKCFVFSGFANIEFFPHF
jgi:hypothetical protein